MLPLRILVTAVLCLIFISPVYAGTADYSLMVNGRMVYADVPLAVDGFEVLVPLRAVAEAIDAGVQYMDQERVVIISRPGLEAILRLDTYSFTKNGSPILLRTPAVLINNRTFVTREQLVEILGVDAYLNIRDNSFIVEG